MLSFWSPADPHVLSLNLNIWNIYWKTQIHNYSHSCILVFNILLVIRIICLKSQQFSYLIWYEFSFLKIYEKIFCLLKVTEKFFAIRRLVLSGGPNSQLSSLLSAFVNFHTAVLCCEDLSCAIIIYCPKKFCNNFDNFHTSYLFSIPDPILISQSPHIFPVPNVTKNLATSGCNCVNRENGWDMCVDCSKGCQESDDGWTYYHILVFSHSKLSEWNKRSKMVNLMINFNFINKIRQKIRQYLINKKFQMNLHMTFLII